ncbi:MAG: hypothetical protein LBF01_03035, partial [Bacteroidales bacterium]|nr:hypothetical protein [Bacteroidales bacterium]
MNGYFSVLLVDMAFIYNITDVLLSLWTVILEYCLLIWRLYSVLLSVVMVIVMVVVVKKSNC